MSADSFDNTTINQNDWRIILVIFDVDWRFTSMHLGAQDGLCANIGYIYARPERFYVCPLSFPYIYRQEIFLLQQLFYFLVYSITILLLFNIINLFYF